MSGKIFTLHRADKCADEIKALRVEVASLRDALRAIQAAVKRQDGPVLKESFLKLLSDALGVK